MASPDARACQKPVRRPTLAGTAGVTTSTTFVGITDISRDLMVSFRARETFSRRNLSIAPNPPYVHYRYYAPPLDIEGYPWPTEQPFTRHAGQDLAPAAPGDRRRVGERPLGVAWWPPIARPLQTFRAAIAPSGQTWRAATLRQCAYVRTCASLVRTGAVSGGN